MSERNTNVSAVK